MATDPTSKPLDYPDIDDVDANGMTLADLDPESEAPPERCEDERTPKQGPAEGPDIG